MSKSIPSLCSARLPLVVTAGLMGENSADVDVLIAFYREHTGALEEALLRQGAILFRGYNAASPATFSRFVRAVSDRLLDYTDGNSPRRKLASGIYTSTEYPAPYFISLHNELSYSHAWPRKLFFCCVVAPAQGGETPLADCRTILKSLDPQIVEEFKRKQVKYIRNLHAGRGLGPSWQETFETTNKDKVEHYCRRAAVNFSWRADGGLRIVNVRPAVAVHPLTAEEVWFNQADQFHPSTHPEELRASLLSFHLDGHENMPQYACFGDDTPITVSMLDEIRATTRRLAVTFPWQPGDLLMIDNMLVSHGRMPFVGPRKILVSMS